MNELRQRIDQLQVRLLKVQLQTQEAQCEATKAQCALLLRKSTAEAETAEVVLEKERFMADAIRKAVEANDLPKIKSLSS